MICVTVLPIHELEVDAAIMFADIMLPLASLGIEFDIVESVGPVIAEPIRSATQIRALSRIPIAESVPNVLEAIAITRNELAASTPLIGFSGAPFTLACYLIEGKASREFSMVRGFMLSEPDAWEELLGRLTDMVIEYLTAQVAAGAQAVQLFDSWIGALGAAEVERSVLPHMIRIFDAVAALGVPSIHFGTGTGALLELMARPACDVIGVDWRTPLDVAWDRVGTDRAVQGNLDPAVLLAPAPVIREHAIDVLRRAGGRAGHIFNLGHGVLPDTPLDSIKVLIDTVHGYQGDA
jgi:uroporphyrinogen decarboxylase